MKLEKAFVLLVLGLACIAPCSFAEDEAEEEKGYRYGSVRLGAFRVGQINHSVGAQVDTFSEATFYKTSYTWMIYDQDKVAIGASVGLNVIDFSVKSSFRIRDLVKGR